MYCYKCGKEIKDDSRFCIYCGEVQTRTAPRPGELTQEKKRAWSGLEYAAPWVLSSAVLQFAFIKMRWRFFSVIMGWRFFNYINYILPSWPRVKFDGNAVSIPRYTPQVVFIMLVAVFYAAIAVTRGFSPRKRTSLIVVLLLALVACEGIMLLASAY